VVLLGLLVEVHLAPFEKAACHFSYVGKVQITNST
jgi:hypothetical protein